MARPRFGVRLKVVFNDLGKTKAALPREVSQVVRKGTFDIDAHATVNTPVDTGALKNSKQVEFFENGMRSKIGWSAEHAIYVHEGTRRMSARPFAKDAFDQVAPSIVDALNQLASKLGR